MNIKKFSEQAVIPKRATSGSAGYDLCAAEDVTIEPGTCVKVNTGLGFEIFPGFFGAIYSRSGLATKRGLRVAQGTAVIDSDYRGAVLVPLYNDSNETQTIQTGERIAQIVFQSFMNIGDFREVEQLAETTRGEGGFGSTGT